MCHIKRIIVKNLDKSLGAPVRTVKTTTKRHQSPLVTVLRASTQRRIRITPNGATVDTHVNRLQCHPIGFRLDSSIYIHIYTYILFVIRTGTHLYPSSFIPYPEVPLFPDSLFPLYLRAWGHFYVKKKLILDATNVHPSAVK